jgi:hypothetical protein
MNNVITRYQGFKIGWQSFGHYKVRPIFYVETGNRYFFKYRKVWNGDLIGVLYFEAMSKDIMIKLLDKELTEYKDYLKSWQE